MQEPHRSQSSQIARPAAIVGIGCAAGGVDAIEVLLRGLPKRLGAAFVIVQHANTESSDLLVDVISRISPLTVTSLDENPIQLERDHIYLVPQRSIVRQCEAGFSAKREEHRDQRAAVIDGLFRTIAAGSRVPSVGVLLSGSGSDGTLGLSAIRDAGGLAIVQDGASAEHAEMPQNAAATADLILPPAKMIQELAAHIRHASQRQENNTLATQAARIEANLPRICDALLAATDYEFRQYKKRTLIRRVSRRMQVARINDVDDYLRHLQAEREEAYALFRELLVSVTAFFRDPDTYTTLAELVLPKLFDRRSEGEPIRVWVPGCATGQEAYTLAMLMVEERDKHGHDIEIQIFATDIDQRALKLAREGSYSAAITGELTEQRLNRFFNRIGKQYTVRKEIWEMCVFSVHNLVSDPPLSQMDLISCRNLLIYFGQPLQLKLISAFHFALRPQGYLLLGPSENLTSHTEVFRPIDQRRRISQRKPGPGRSTAIFSGENRLSLPASLAAAGSLNELDIHRIAQRIVLDEFAPRYAIVNEHGHIVCTSNGLERYFEFPDGPFANNVVKIAKSGLRIGLRASLRESRESLRTVVRDGLTLNTHDGVERIQLTVQPLPQISEESCLFMLIFHERGAAVSRKGAEDLLPDSEAAIEQLECELDQTRTDLESTVQDLEGSNEELKSSNEELRSLNEELQSANEELETAKEETQTGLEALARARSDLQNLLDGTQIATIFLDSEGNINSFTSTARDIYNVRETDVGRPLSEITHKAFEMPSVPIADALSTAVDYIEDEIRTSESRWFLRRVLPYRIDGQPAGVILTFVDISDKKREEIRLAAAHRVTRLLVDADSFDEALPELLEGLRQTLNADVCSLWLVEPAAPRLYCSHSTVRTRSQRLAEFVDASRRWKFESGEGLPGHVWKSLEPYWIEDVTSTAEPSELRFERRTMAAEFGLVCGIALPIMTGKRFRGVIEFFADRKLDREQSLLDILRDVGHEIGQFIRRKHLDDKFRDEEVRRAAILAAALDCIITMDMQGNIVDFNAAAEETFGCSSAEVTGRPLADVLIPAELRNAHREGIVRYLRTGASEVIGKRVELTAQRADGTQFPIELAINASHNRDGSPFFTGYLRDISERKAAEEILHQRAELAALHGALAVSLAGEAPLSEILHTCCQLLVDALDAAFARVWLLNEQEAVLHLAASAGIYTHLDGDHSRVPLGELKIGRIAAHRQPLQTNDVGNDPNIGDADWAMREGMVAFAGYPLVVENRVVGVVALFARHELAAQVFEQLLPMADAMAQCIARKGSEQALLDREAHLRRVINNQLGLVGVIDRDGILREVDADSMKIAGVSRDEVIGKHFAECPWWAYDESVSRRMRESMQKAFAGEIVRYDVPLYAAGLGGPRERLMIDFMLAPVRDAEGNITHLIPSGVDISDRVRAERAQRENEERLKMALRAGGLAAWEWNPRESVWTDELYELLGIPLGRTASPELFFECVHPDDLAGLKEAWQLATDGKADYLHEFRIVRPNGEVRWIVGVGQVVRDDDGNLVRIFGLNRDSTQEHAAAEALRTSEQNAQLANASKSEFVANMSHEIRTPMTAVLGYADLLLALEDDREKLEHLRTIQRNGNFLLEIINDILDLSKIEAGKLEFVSEKFSVVEVVGDVRSMMQVRAAEKNLSLFVEFEGEIPEQIESDPKRLRQILINLMGNAIKFTPAGSVRLTVREVPDQGGKMQFEIVDTGIGMTQEQQSRLFQAFTQGDASVSRAFGGTGLGLAISQRLAAMLGGEITVDSEFGKGSNFTCTIAIGDVSGASRVRPILDGSIESADASHTLGATDRPLNCRVLVVDDRRDVRFLSRRLLMRAGADVEEAEDGLDALERLQADAFAIESIDLILLDMQMPRLDGYQTATRLRQLGFNKPIVALTADAMQSDMNRCIEAGCNAFLSKPIDNAKLIDTVARFTNHE